MTTIRAFIAISLPAAVAASLQQTVLLLARQTPPGSVRWVKPEAIHLTLRFLGETAVDRLPALASALDQVTAGHPPFELRLDRLGCFPNPRWPRIIWAGVADERQQSQALAAAVEELVAGLGWPRDARPFRPHLTLGRVKGGGDFSALPWGQKLEPLAIPVHALRLIESQLRPAGPLYTIRHTSKLFVPWP